jgi:hypothetical protein
MKFLDKWFYRKSRWAWNRAEQQYPELKWEQDLLDKFANDDSEDNYSEVKIDKFTIGGSKKILAESASDYDQEEIHKLYDGLQLYVKRVNGGYVITFRISNPSDKHGNYVEPTKSTHIITDEQDFYETLSKLMTIELIRN